jgi:hypothetical protein
MRYELSDYEWDVIRPSTGSQRTASQITQRLKALAVEQSIDTDSWTGNMPQAGLGFFGYRTFLEILERARIRILA